MNKRAYRKLAVVFTALLLLLLVGAGSLWLRGQQRQYVLNRRLIAAVVNNDVKQAITFVNRGADPNTPYKPSPVPSLQQLVGQLLHRSPPHVNDSPTALMISCGAGWKQDDGASSTQNDDPDESPMVKAMLKHEANVNAKGEQGMTPLMAASYFGHAKTALLLLEHGADVNAQDDNGRTPLQCALEYWPDKQTIRQLLAHGADPNLADKKGLTPLMLAKQHERPDVVALLRQAGARK